MRAAYALRARAVRGAAALRGRRLRVLEKDPCGLRTGNGPPQYRRPPSRSLRLPLVRDGPAHVTVQEIRDLGRWHLLVVELTRREFKGRYVSAHLGVAWA